MCVTSVHTFFGHSLLKASQNALHCFPCLYFLHTITLWGRIRWKCVIGTILSRKAEWKFKPGFPRSSFETLTNMPHWLTCTGCCWIGRNWTYHGYCKAWSWWAFPQRPKQPCFLLPHLLLTETQGMAILFQLPRNPHNGHCTGHLFHKCTATVFIIWGKLTLRCIATTRSTTTDFRFFPNLLESPVSRQG